MVGGVDFELVVPPVAPSFLLSSLCLSTGLEVEVDEV